MFRCVLLFALWILVSPVSAQDPSVVTLIRQLGSSKYAEREEAARSLEQLGEKALLALADAEKNPDFEVRQRARRLQEKIQDRLVVAKLLEPGRLKLQFKDVFLHEALRDFQKHAGLPTVLSDNLAKGNPRVTWQSADEPFWQAWSGFCDNAGLTEPIAVPPHLTRVKIEPGLFFPHLTGEDLRLKATPDLGVLHLLEKLDQAIAADLSRSIRFRGVLRPARQFEGRRKIVLLDDQVFLLLEICPAPSVPWSALESVRIHKVVDGENRSLPLPRALTHANPSLDFTRKEETPAKIDLSRKMNTEVQAIRLPRSPVEKPLREIQGAISARLITRPTKFEFKNVLKSQGQTRHAGDASLYLIEAEVQDDGDLFVRVHLENFKALVQDHPGPRLIRPRPGFVAERGPADLAADAFELRDAGGRLLSCAEVRQKGLDHENAVELQFIFRGSGNEAQPLTLSFAAYRAISVEVPFTLRDLPLP